jgi:putative spermidine/putrescine transport system substrate-binding protein/putrescine transport system substrate-binding protein
MIRGRTRRRWRRFAYSKNDNGKAFNRALIRAFSKLKSGL